MERSQLNSRNVSRKMSTAEKKVIESYRGNVEMKTIL